MRTTSITTDDLGFLLAKASQRFNALLIDRLRERGFDDVRPSFGSVLVPLFAAGEMRLGELSRASHMSKQAITGLVKDCERAELVARSRDPHDGRAFRVALTERGEELRSVVEVVLAELRKQAVAELGERNYKALVRGLKGVMEL